MISVTIKHGLEAIEKRFEEPTYVGNILANAGVLAAIGASEASVAIVNGGQVTGSYELVDGDTIVLEKQAASKA